MSRAFVRESDQDPDERLPDRPISPYPNFVTASGLKQIQALDHALEAAPCRAVY
jgi:transcription elongation factor GreB